MNEKEMELLACLEKNGRLSAETLAKMLNTEISEVQEMKEKLERDGIIVDYVTLIDWSKVKEHSGLTAMIDVKVTPKHGVGFDAVAEQIYRYSEVKSVYLMSGTYDLSITLEGKTMGEVAVFVSEKLATIESVVSTTTHFILKKYKHEGIVYDRNDDDKRIVVAP
ncbi:AsnC family transcriptional regulator [Bacillus manliponensis]|uniref:AsnC family transcriptional regulator n=1 Tax=Bacillus manliponensis TaxID=574376 RepID=A0A073K4G2_9BACI|nr:Lrp/AsnC family transcriptional regulator [Bacillus manliponensis]KEK17178.1 AsnC family transcriptional regulator [Bacillus manliponensis]